MNTIRNIIAFLIGLFLGGMLNMLIISYGGSIIPPPENVDPNDIESIKENMHLYTPLHFLVPFIAHAVGTLFGAFIVAFLAASYRMYLSLAIGAFFLLGGVTMVMMLPSPLWFNILDLGLAYMPMAWLGWKLTGKD